jgi:hypothetical protein
MCGWKRRQTEEAPAVRHKKIMNGPNFQQELLNQVQFSIYPGKQETEPGSVALACPTGRLVY